jgi:hypothetical protein
MFAKSCRATAVLTPPINPKPLHRQLCDSHTCSFSSQLIRLRVRAGFDVLSLPPSDDLRTCLHWLAEKASSSAGCRELCAEILQVFLRTRTAHGSEDH